MKIIIGNDDGIDSKGIFELVKELSKEHEILVLAPSEDRSGFSHSLSVRKPIYVVESKNFEQFGVKAYHMTGTPADCIKLGLDIFKEFAPDVVLGGINHGANLGMDVMYSGTCGVAMEGALAGFCGVAVSLDGGKNGGHFDVAAKVVRKFLPQLYERYTGENIWNINVPNKEYDDLKGVMLSQIGVQIYEDIYKKFETEDGIYYSLGGYTVEHNQNHPNGDVEVVKNGYVSITPVKVNRTDFEELEKAKAMSLVL